jgi:pimeloyl-ACP methyl ester carboxylesterase
MGFRNASQMRAAPPPQILRLILGALGVTAVLGLAAEAIQSAAEYGRLVSDPIFEGEGVAHGDGHPVMVIPGFLGSDGYLDILREWLGRIGYAPLASEMGRNTGYKQELLDLLERRVLAAAKEAGTSVSIIGHSLGGIFARAIARKNPDIVRQIVTMGSPLRFDKGQVSVPFTAIYSRGDRIVRYPRAFADDPGARNVEAGGCHVGMAFNADVYRAIGETLSAAAASKAS